MQHIKEIAGHSVDTSRLRSGGHALDIGCRGFEFGDHLAAYGITTVGVDIDDLGTDRAYHRCGISASSGRGSCSSNHDPSARKIICGDAIAVYSFEDFCAMAGVRDWSVLKLDCEGSECGILLSLQRPVADQISVEFHQHTTNVSEDEIGRVVDHLKQWYRVIRHERDSRHGCGLNYWDSLFVLK